MADDVLIKTSSFANFITWYGAGQSSANFRVRIFDDQLDHPSDSAFYDAPLGFLTGVNTGLLDAQRREIFKYASPIPPVGLNSSTTYWLSIASTDSTPWFWSHAAENFFRNDSFSRYGEMAPWQSLISFGWRGDRLEKAFTLENIPEPSSLLLVSILLAACRIRHRH
jgi:hypothetical protein